MRNAAANAVAGLLTLLLFVVGFGALSSCGEREHAPTAPRSSYSAPTYVPRPTPDPTETEEPAQGEPIDVEVHVDHDDDHHRNSRWCPTRWC